MPAKALSVIIPAREEEWLDRTVDDILSKIECDTEVIAVLDGYLPSPPISANSSKFRWLYYRDPIGQRGATNEGVKFSEAKYVMKIDAHCSVDQGFDRKLIEPYETGEIGMDTTTIPRMFRFHVFDWVCSKCNARYYQADPVENCKCGRKEFVKDVVWKPRMEKGATDFGRFDHTLRWQYWTRYTRRRPEEEKKQITDVMSSIGACFLMPRQRYIDIDGFDEAHGFWGNYGVEIACKSFLSGGRQVVNKRTWYSHFFRNGKLKFPYPISGNAQERAWNYSRDLWFNNRWPKQVRPLSWLIEKFAPVRDWHDKIGAEALAAVNAAGVAFSIVNPLADLAAPISERVFLGKEMSSFTMRPPTLSSCPSISPKDIFPGIDQSEMNGIDTSAVVTNMVNNLEIPVEHHR